MALIACILFIAAALRAGGGITLWSWEVWIALGFAAWVISGGIIWPPVGRRQP